MPYKNSVPPNVIMQLFHVLLFAAPTLNTMGADITKNVGKSISIGESASANGKPDPAKITDTATSWTSFGMSYLPAIMKMLGGK